LKQKGLDDMTQSATNRDMFIDDPIDLNGDYTDIEDPQPQNQMHKNEIGKARLRGFMTHGRTLFRYRGLIGTTIAGVWCSYSFDHKLLTGHLAVYKRCLQSLILLVGVSEHP